MSVPPAGGALMSNPAREERQIVYDWNQLQSAPKPAQPFDFDDESLRDGVQSPSVTDPPLAAKIELYTFIGSSPIRQYAETWDLDFILRASTEAIDFGIKEGLQVAYVTEDTTRASPPNLERLFRNAIDHGASRLVLCDTVGHATPEGTAALIGWTSALIAKSGAEVKVDWHGHNDRGLAVGNAIAALQAGVHRVHACGLGIGERVGNTSMDPLLLNLKLMGWIDYH